MSSICRLIRPILLCSVSLTLLSGCTESGSDRTQKAARSNAELFLVAFKNGDGKAAFALLTPVFQSRLSDEERHSQTLKLTTWAVGLQPISGWQLREENFEGPNPHFKGLFHSKDSNGILKDYEFQLKLEPGILGHVDWFTSEAVAGK